MQLKVLRSKLHLATVTRSDLYYHGSLTIDPDLMDAVGLLPYEAILVSNVATGARAETYVLPGARGSGVIELNGAMARIGAVGDRVIVMAFAHLDAAEVGAHQPRVVALDSKNRIVERIDYPPLGEACASPLGGPDHWADTI
ncbi:aspartate 1-decarboxylase [Planctomyces sp. SH-PL62]|uniref:aspartate 1-decarboxylase n=1 Tax=Planctomyces sp. SH-PL62 TaxID=1636152 RepID=UPI00078E6180|nr:aspartate 1-decarboxylase [Planctomyces sp. SH-PL62]AMV39042.1 Aspartate 1-decarboxylase precursor [Planctomyces sp. SH-PL62]